MRQPSPVRTRRRLHWKIRRLRTAKDATDIFRGTPEQVRGVHPIGGEHNATVSLLQVLSWTSSIRRQVPINVSIVYRPGQDRVSYGDSDALFERALSQAYQFERVRLSGRGLRRGPVYAERIKVFEADRTGRHPGDYIE
jgi:hypothetical protein